MQMQWKTVWEVKEDIQSMARMELGFFLELTEEYTLQIHY